MPVPSAGRGGPLEEAKDALGVLGREAEAVVRHEEGGVPLPDPDRGRRVRLSVLARIANEVGEQRLDEDGIGHDGNRTVEAKVRVGAHVAHDVVGQGSEVERLAVDLGGAGAGVVEQVVNELAHLQGRLLHALNALERVGVEDVAVVELEHPPLRGDGADRGAQVV